MIRIVLSKKEKLILEIAYFSILSDKRKRKNRYVLEKLLKWSSDNEMDEEHLTQLRNEIGLERVVKKIEGEKLKIREDSFVRSDDFPLNEISSEKSDNLKLLRDILLLNPLTMVHTNYSAMTDDNLKKIKCMMNMLQMYHITKQYPKKDARYEKIKKWLMEDDNYESVIAFLKYISVDLEKGKLECIDLLAKNPVLMKDICSELEFLYKYLSDAFDYNELINSSSENHYIISTLMKTSVCPYCNRQYISVLNKVRKGTTTFDHYYREAMYPLLKLSLYNLVPACYCCNTILKNISDFEHLNPWYEGSKGLEFVMEVDKEQDIQAVLDNYYLGYSNSGYSKNIIKIENTLGDERARNSLNVFELVDLYQIHNHDAGVFRAKAMKYENGNFKDVIMKNIKGATEEVVDVMLYGFPSKYMDSESEAICGMSIPLFKMRRDILMGVKSTVSNRNEM